MDVREAKKGRCAWLTGSLLGVAGLLLSACQHSTPAGESVSNKISLLPESKITDYRTVSCTNIWHQAEFETQENALYWLRAMDCASTLSRPQAKEMALAITPHSWEDAFRQGILLANADITPEQRTTQLNVINEYRIDVPATLSPLLQLWRDQQTSVLSLQEERKKYRQLQTSTDNKIDSLKEQESHLRYQLEEMSKKLAGLTDIERQLSTRKQLQGSLPAEGEKGHASELKPTGETDKGAAEPAAPKETK
ncbi:MAG: two-component system QseEF-associated lipoprotein QseG [Enterobacteriaceae bacterium]